MKFLIKPNEILYNFSIIKDLEDKYVYIIELGSKLDFFPKNLYRDKYLIRECINNVWILKKYKIVNSIKTINLFGDSDSLIVKGLIAIVFSLYNGLSKKEIIKLNIKPFFKKLNLEKYLTISRLNGLESIIRKIKHF